MASAEDIAMIGADAMGDTDSITFWDVLGPIVALLFIATVFACMFWFDRLWQRRQSCKQVSMQFLNDSHSFTLNLVRHFMPSIKVARYEFRGMKKREHTCSLSFENLGLVLPSGRCILAGVTGEFQAGKLCAVMGPSGAGKTTFMNVLCGKATYGTMAGSMKVNNFQAKPDMLKPFMGFVPQDDIVHRSLTVREQIKFSGRLRGDVKWTNDRLELITQDVLNVMQIEHIQNLIVGSVEERGISGGQRKRVNIGLELVAEPTVLFLDEPTSGLDSTSSLAVCMSLQKLCQLGLTSIMVIHQPRYSLFTLFDQVLLLGKGGRTAYLGSSMDATSYFEGLGFVIAPNENPADWFMDVLAGEVPNSKIQNFEPDDLPGLWCNGMSDDRAADGLRHSRTPSLASRTWTHRDDRAVLRQSLMDGWCQCGFDKSGAINVDEMMSLFSRFGRGTPSAGVVQSIMDRMVFPGTPNVSQKQFVNYLCNLSALEANATNVQWNAAQSEISQLPTTWLTPLHDMEPYECNLARIRLACFGQFKVLVRRQLVQWWRMNLYRALFMGALVLGGMVLGHLDGNLLKSSHWDAAQYLNLHLTVILLLSIFSLGVFGQDQPMFWRESASGISIFAYFNAKIVVNTIDVVLQTVLFVSVYYLVRHPAVPYWNFLWPFLVTAYAGSGWGYLVSTMVPPQQGAFIVALISFVTGGLMGNPELLHSLIEQDSGVAEFIVSGLSITRWSVQVSFLAACKYKNAAESESQKYMGCELVYGECASETDGIAAGCWRVSAIGCVLHVLAFLGLRFRNRSKQV